MPRPTRPDVPDAWYHVMNRGGDRQDIFGPDADYLRFEALVADAVERFGVELHAYCLMTNHFHLLLHCPTGGLSKAMQSIEQHYTQWYNARYLRDGPLYRGRFHSVDVSGEAQFVHTVRYIHRNPLAFVPAGALAAYRWSSYGVYLQRRPCPSWLNVQQVLEPFGSEPDAYRTYVETDGPSDEPVRARVPLSSERITLPLLLNAVAVLCGVDRDIVCRRAHGVTNPSRLVAITLAVELRVAPTAELSGVFGLASSASVRTLARRGRVTSTVDSQFALLRQRVLDVMFGASCYVVPDPT